MSSNKNHFDSIEFPSPFFRLHQRSKRRPKCSFRGSAHSAHGFVRIGRCAHAPVPGVPWRCDQPWRCDEGHDRAAISRGAGGRSLPTLAARAVAEVAVHEDSAACRRGRPAESSWTQALDMSPCEAEHHWPCNWKHNQRESIDASVALPPRRGSGALGPTSSCSAF